MPSFMGFNCPTKWSQRVLSYMVKLKKRSIVCQPPWFEDPDHPDKVYKVVKALYGLHQAPRAWYDTLATYLLSNGFKRVFEKLMKDKFQMSSMGELTFFLGLQVQQKKKGIFISQDKYVHEILKKFNYTDVKSASTPTDLERPLVKDSDADDVDEHLYRSMIGSLMYLTASRPDIMFAVCACARSWYSKESPLELVAYTDSDYAGATLDRKSTTGVYQMDVKSAFQMMVMVCIIENPVSNTSTSKIQY
ncbi:putative ribonuclease H-like domain-containing protein [Tanacetum coccineum]